LPLLSLRFFLCARPLPHHQSIRSHLPPQCAPLAACTHLYTCLPSPSVAATHVHLLCVHLIARLATRAHLLRATSRLYPPLLCVPHFIAHCPTPNRFPRRTCVAATDSRKANNTNRKRIGYVLNREMYLGALNRMQPN
jgi:hypothetical protein